MLIICDVVGPDSSMIHKGWTLGHQNMCTIIITFWKALWKFDFVWCVINFWKHVVNVNQEKTIAAWATTTFSKWIKWTQHFVSWDHMNSRGFLVGCLGALWIAEDFYPTQNIEKKHKKKKHWTSCTFFNVVCSSIWLGKN